MNTHQKEILLFTVLLIISVAALYLNPGTGEEPEIVENGTTAEYNSQPLDFQGETNRTNITDEGLKLDTYTEVNKENLTEASTILTATSEAVYIKYNGDTYKWKDNEKQKIDIDATYGAAAGDFKQYEGFNLIYADRNQDIHVKNLNTDSERVLETMKAVEITKTDADKDGISESAELKLRNGSTIILEPRQKKSRRDIDGDGYRERINLKNKQLVLYDRKHGQKELAAANSYAIQNQTIYTASNNQLSKLELKQKYYSSGTYTSNPITTEGKLAQIITYTELNNRKAELTLNSGEKHQLEDQYTEIKPDIETENLTVEIKLQTTDPAVTPVVNNYRLVTR